MTTLVLTDTPAVVALKAEFFRLSEREEEVKAIQRGADDLVYEMAAQELRSVRERKRQIAVEIFNTADFRMVA